MTRTIEDIILDHDRRGINALRPHVPADFCTQAARYALVHSGPVIIATGFYIMMSDAPETDGPPGAFAIGNALRELGNPVMYTADEPVAYMMASWRDQPASGSLPDHPVPHHRGSQHQRTLRAGNHHRA